jgi:hypothetical protein
MLFCSLTFDILSGTVDIDTNRCVTVASRFAGQENDTSCPSARHEVV